VYPALVHFAKVALVQDACYVKKMHQILRIAHAILATSTMTVRVYRAMIRYVKLAVLLIPAHNALIILQICPNAPATQAFSNLMGPA
jgi:hypothetical protein